MACLYFITHPEVVVDARTPVERWHLSASGIERMRTFSRLPKLAGLRAIWSSTETKAIEAAGILAAVWGLGVSVSQALGENDRSATGFLPPAEFEQPRIGSLRNRQSASAGGSGRSTPKRAFTTLSRKLSQCIMAATLRSSPMVRWVRCCFAR